MATILIVDDHPSKRELFATLLAYAGHHTLEASNGNEALKLLENEIPDLIITDILMPNMDGFTLASVPIIFQTAHYLTEEVRRLASDCGVRHILGKPIEPEPLFDMVNQALIHRPSVSNLPKTKEFQQQHLQLLATKLYQKVTELEKTNIHLQNLSLTDDLTGISNRRGFMIRAEELLKFARRLGYPMCLLYLDLDRLKHINDTFGHLAGDNALRDLARILTQTFRESDTIARLGGDEFAVLAIHSSASHVEPLQRRLQSNLKAHNASAKHRYRLAISLGVIHLDPKSNLTIHEVLNQADGALYADKQQKQKGNKRD